MAGTGCTTPLRAHAGSVAVLLAVFLVLLALDPPGSGGSAWPRSTPGDRSAPFAHDPWIGALYFLSLVGGAPLHVALHALALRWSRRTTTTGP